VQKAKLSLVAILSTSAIATGIVLNSASSAQPCSRLKWEYEQQEQYEQANNWWRSPWAMVLTLPGIAIAAALSLGDRYYKKG
jgi:hypothetical protein